MNEFPRRPDGTIDLARLAGELARDLHPLGSRLTACAGHLAFVRELLPARGELVEEVAELVTHLAWIENAYRAADERICEAAFLIDHHERVPNPLPLGEPAP